eukprot:CAMPEP_0183383178 /NCGR_PEP_ID=MMETSP0164_2-20130417/127319_1 /TAXON_ID=221442 /ORGANISM="Coccolithus pelagicus ssp braarudi, Strain PLY182g" /LENGTH=65 /DNA_ID=CAMNT_0025560809 /DNA_START=170 /DNA_END=367 /DNA_ORIENTATION=+
MTIRNHVCWNARAGCCECMLDLCGVEGGRRGFTESFAVVPDAFHFDDVEAGGSLPGGPSSPGISA